MRVSDMGLRLKKKPVAHVKRRFSFEIVKTVKFSQIEVSMKDYCDNIKISKRRLKSMFQQQKR